MKSTIWPVVALLLFSCGDDSASEETLEGAWYLESDSKECALGLSLDGGDFELMTLCELESGDFAAEVQAGTFAEDGSRITFQPVKSSCADDRAYPITMQYEFIDGGLLRLVSPDGVLIFDRVDAPPNEGRTAFGCYDDMGLFTPMPVEIIGR